MVSVGTPEEFKHRMPISLGLLVYIFIVGIGIGAGIAMFNYALAEISGVRADFEKEDAAIHKELDLMWSEMKSLEQSTNARIDRKIDNHNEAKNAHK